MAQRIPLSPTRCTTLNVETGNLCGRQSCPDAPFPICREHAQAVYLYVETKVLARDIDQDAEREALYAEHAKWREKWNAEHPPVDRSSEVVYYMRFGDRVKIGYTTNIHSRLMAVPHDELLATEPGPMSLEQTRHRQFADLRITGEWFRYEDPLVTHIAAL